MGYGNNRGGGFGGQGGGQPGGINIFGPLPPTIMYLIIANVAVFFISIIMPQLVYPWLSLVPGKVFPGAQVWRIVTYMFMHGDFGHILFNMLTLWWFGGPLVQIWGQKRFLTYYFLCGIGAGIICVPFYIIFGGSDIPIVGASGALYGVLIAFALIHPNAKVYLYFLFPIKVKWLVLFFVVMEFTSTASYAGGNTSSTVASIAHLSGMAIGYFHLRGLMDFKAYYLNYKHRKVKKAYRVINGEDQGSDDKRGPWLH
jgi:rhomboid family protein